MPDPVRCSADPAHPNTFSCEPVVIGSEPAAAPSVNAPAPTQRTVPAQPTAPPPAVAALVKRFPTVQHEAHAAPVSTVTAGTAVQCLGQVNAIAVLMLGVKGPLLAAAGGFKVGYDLGACVAKDLISRQLSADKHAALQYCLDEGGTPTGEVGNDLMCTVTVTP